MAVRRYAYEAPGWGVGELWLDDGRPVWHELPTAKRSVRAADRWRGSGGTGRFPQLPGERPPVRAADRWRGSGGTGRFGRVAPVRAADRWRGSGGTGRFPQLPGERPPRESAAPLLEWLAAYFTGAPVEFGDVEVEIERATPFRRALADALRAVPRGEVVTYGELAALAGRPGAARAAGTFCARNALPILIPCHRVVSADGIGGYGSLGVEYKRRLLALEGYDIARAL